MKHTILVLLSLIAVSCTEKIIIEPQEGPQLLGVYGSITDELKNQEITISRTSEFNDTGEPEMISDAIIFVHDGTDTIWYEETDTKGKYQTIEKFAGRSNHTYYLSVDLPEHEGGGHYYAQTKMYQHIDIDSLALKPYVLFGVEFDNMIGLYPYFQTLKDKDVCYMIKSYINNNFAATNGEKLTNYGIADCGGMAGIYANGPLMVSLLGEEAFWAFSTEDSASTDSLVVLHKGDTVRMEISVIPREYAGYISDISSSIGSNPMMGSPSNVSTNIRPDGTAVGFFFTTAAGDKTIIY